MIVKNEYIKIKSDKEITLRNYIYDNYLKLVTQSQYSTGVKDFSFNACYIKLNTPFEDITGKTINDFTLRIPCSYKNMVGSENSIEANYTYNVSNNYVYDITSGEQLIDLSKYDGEKITAIGFSVMLNGDDIICACVDTSNYSAYFKENISFQRKDIFSSDTTSTENYPANLMPFSQKYIVENTGHGEELYYCYPVLYSIGLGVRTGEIEEEYIIGEDVDIIIKSDTSFGFNIRKGLEHNKYPSQSLYARNGLFPLPLKVSKEIHPNRKLYAGSGIVPLLSDYKYIIYKYRYYYYDDFAYDDVYLDEYFTINLLNDTKGLFEIVTKFERSDV